MPRNPGNFTSRRMRLAYDGSVTVRDQDGEWLPPRKAVEYVGYSNITLEKWWRPAGQGSPWLDGEKLLRRKFPDGISRPTLHYLKSQLDRVLAARAQKRKDDAKWILLDDAPAAYSWATLAMLRDMTRRGPVRFGGKKVRFRIVAGVSKNGRRCRRVELRREDLDRIDNAYHECRAVDGLSVEELAEEFGVKRSTVHSWLSVGIPGAGGDVLEHGTGRIDFTGRGSFGAIIPRRAVEELRRRLTCADAYIDAEGRRWLPSGEAEKLYPSATRHILVTFRNKPCPWLGGAELHAMQVSMMYRGQPRTELWVYLEDDLKRLEAPKLGNPQWAKATSAAQPDAEDVPTVKRAGKVTPAVVLGDQSAPVTVRGTDKPPLPPGKYRIVKALLAAFPAGLTKDELAKKGAYTDPHKLLKELCESDSDWDSSIERPGRGHRGGYRILPL